MRSDNVTLSEGTLFKLVMIYLWSLQITSFTTFGLVKEPVQEVDGGVHSLEFC